MRNTNIENTGKLFYYVITSLLELNRSQQVCSYYALFQWICPLTNFFFCGSHKIYTYTKPWPYGPPFKNHWYNSLFYRITNPILRWIYVLNSLRKKIKLRVCIHLFDKMNNVGCYLKYAWYFTSIKFINVVIDLFLFLKLFFINIVIIIVITSSIPVVSLMAR